MRSKYRRRASPPPPRGSRRMSQALVGLVLVVLGAALALSAERLVTNTPSPGTKATATPSAPLTVASSPPASAEAAASTAPSASPSPAAPVLEAEMPHSINGTTLTVQSTTNATSLGGDPSSRALGAAVTSLGKEPGDLEIAEAYDASGALALTVLGFRVAGVDATKLRSVVLDAWLSINTPGVTSSSVSLSGTSSTKVDYGDGGPNDFVFVHGDSVFVVVTADQSLAANAVAAMAAISPSPSGG